ncbi:MAG: polysaccharide biosynthesis tyrosine autokinase [Gemmatimonadetes bacterium]|nr:polysaccharide biosynthesis tyrosine autokinase [Gemmatimonadota bacterium]
MVNKLPIPAETPGGLDLTRGRAWGGGAAGGAPPGGMEAGITRLLMALYRFKWMILVVTALAAGAGLVATRFRQPVYETRAQVWIGGQGLAGGQAGAPIQQGALLGQQAWANLLRSAAVLDSVVMNRRLYLSVVNTEDWPAFDGFDVDKANLNPGTFRIGLDASGSGFVLSDAQGTVLQRGAFGDSVGVSVGFRWAPARDGVPSGRPIEFTVRPPGEISNWLAARITTFQGRPGEDQSFMRISMQGADRFEVQATLDAIITRFEQVALQLKKERLTERSNILQQQLSQAEQELFDKEQALENFQIETATLPTEERGVGAPLPAGLAVTDNSVYGSFFTLNTMKDQLVRDRQAVERILRDPPDISTMVVALENIPSTQKSSSLRSALGDASGAQSALRMLTITMRAEHPQVKAQNAHLDSLRTIIIPRYARELLAEMTRQESELDAQSRNLALEMREIPQRQIQQSKLMRQVAIAAQLYQQLETSYQTAKLAELVATPDISIVDRPTVPLTPVTDTRQMLLLMVLAGGFGLALALAVLRDRLDARLQYPDQVTAGMGLNILGAVPALRSGRLGSGDMALAVEAFRSIQLSLMHTSENGGPLTVTFTSPGASDGKSFVTSNLAIAFADMGHRTLVIDGDVRRGSIHQLLGVRHKPGLTDYLAGNAGRGEVIQQTQYPMLQVIACGSRGEAGPKLLGSPAMRDLVRDLRPDYDVILVDSPPLGACVDPMILGTLTRNLVLVLRTGTTDRSLAESKLDMLDRLPVRVVGAVLNDVTQGGVYRYYSYMSGYEVLDDQPVAEIGFTAEDAPAEPEPRDDEPVPS